LFQAYLFQNIPDAFYPSFGVLITVQVMAVTRQSTGDHRAIQALF
jgi:hypothetical protein